MWIGLCFGIRSSRFAVPILTGDVSWILSTVTNDCRCLAYSDAEEVRMENVLRRAMSVSKWVSDLMQALYVGSIEGDDSGLLRDEWKSMWVSVFCTEENGRSSWDGWENLGANERWSRQGWSVGWLCDTFAAIQRRKFIFSSAFSIYLLLRHCLIIGSFPSSG